ncbi:vWA domain-containing protein [Phytohabitans rumicis]|uniref:vWA domain-containing protein n=1 Tax=Phytohabitans rumicis TaxID=1076125 RepID=UPI001563165F|nr:vWA domain-containing protein [Phytohabitans rumicis]
MPTPTLTETAPNTNSYTITESKAFIANHSLTLNDFDIQDFIITYPATATVDTLTLQRTGPVPSSVVINLPSLVGLPEGVVVDGFRITVDETPPSGGRITFTVHIAEDTGGGALLQDWELRAKVDGPADWTLSTGGPGAVTRNFVACDPRAVVAAPVAGAVLESENITLTAANPQAGTVLGGLPAALNPGFRWSHTGPIVIDPLPVDTDDDTFEDLAMPKVYRPVPIELRVKTAFGGTDANDTTGFLETESDPVDLEIRARPQHIVLVLDRSGSMGLEGRWDSAVTATRALVHLFANVREGVNPNDRIGIVVFEDNTCAWHALPPSSAIQTRMPMTELPKARNDILTLDLGVPGTCTPIGDGLMAGYDLLATGGPVGDKQYTIIEITDGFQNAGGVFIGSVDPSAGAGLPPGTIQSVTQALTDSAHPLRADIHAAGRLFIIGLGVTVESDLLNELATDTGGQFGSAAQPSQLAGEFGNMLAFSQEITHQQASNTAPPGLPVDANRAYFSTATGAERLVFAVLRGGLPAGEVGLILERWNPATSAFDAEPMDPISSSTHHAGSVVDVIGSTGGAPAIWRLTSVDINGTPLGPLPAANVLAYEDLRVKGTVALNQPAFLTGDDMTVTVRLRHDGSPILGATVRAELDAPGESLGEALAGLGPNVSIKDLVDPKRRDVPPLQAAMIEDVMRRRGWKTWPRTRPTGVFVDGTNLLHDPDGDGNYSNTFAQVFDEGVYRWTLFADGQDTQGHPFDRQLAITTVAGIKVDARATRIRQERIHNHPSKLRAVRVTITPKDGRGKLFGPNKDHLVYWALEDGTFEHVHNQVPAPVFTDGTYRRVILFRHHDRPTLRVLANGTLLPKIRVQD